MLIPTGGRRRRLLSDLKDLERYVENDGRSTADRFAALVRRRDDLDYQFALQLRLRLWVAFHSILTVALVVGGLAHSFIAFRNLGVRINRSHDRRKPSESTHYLSEPLQSTH